MVDALGFLLHSGPEQLGCFPSVEMANPRVQEIKKFLIGRGFLIYRTHGDKVCLAERVRDNLIMDANVQVSLVSTPCVRFMARAQRNDFPSSAETDDKLLERARGIAASALERGFRESGTEVLAQLDPMDACRVLDTWYAIWFEKDISTKEDIAEAVAFALSIDKIAPR